ncbi:preprotein translocase subunit SecG [Bacteroides sedimenti]|uniref:Protein-export membrane protein SecG n=1 Tax=Bacteroides sedimenti TaxID=2136147 RepID=A0ABN6Z451_9BACE
MYLLLVIVIVIAAILLSFIVLIQNSKGGGLSSGFSSSNQIMGVRKTTDLLEKATWTLAAAIVVLSIITSYTVPSNAAQDSAILEQAQKEEKTNPMNAPAGFETPKTGTTPAAAPTAAPTGNPDEVPAKAPAEKPAKK